jgi:hypothetical protein
VEIDQTPADLIVIDERTMMPFGKPTITSALDNIHVMIIAYSVETNDLLISCLPEMGMLVLYGENDYLMNR